MTAAVEAAGVSQRYGRHWALRECCLRLPEGRVVALVGPNGAGKTTLLAVIVGLARPSAGELRVLGDAVIERPEALGRIGFVAQDAPLYRGFTAQEMLRLGARLTGAGISSSRSSGWSGSGSR